MSESSTLVDPARADGRHGGTPDGAPLSHRLLLRLYPRWFRQEFAGELTAHLRHQRREGRYARSPIGTLRFWWEAGGDAVRTGWRLRLGRARERLAWWWRGRPDTGRARPPGRRAPEPEGGVAATLEAILRDIRHALRGLVQSPGYTLVFIVTLGLGIGANAAMFSAVNGVLLRPLPHEDGDRLLYLRQSAARAGIANTLFSVPEIEDFRQGAPSLGAVAEFSALDFTMLGYDTPRRIRAGIVTGNYFDVMGLSATLGRTIGLEDDGEKASAVLVLSHAYWRSVFGGDPGVVGETVEINGRIARIVGVAEPAPPYPERTDVWVNMATSPHHLSAAMNHDRVHRMTEVFAKLAPEATVESARTEVAAIASRLHDDHPEAYDPGAGFEVSVTPLKAQLTRRARPTLVLLLGTAFLVLVIACANLANLTLSRMLRRDHELAIRVSLGGSRGALRRALLVESLILAAGGAALGLLISSLGLDVLVAFAARFTTRASEIALDGSVLGFTLLVTVAASVFFTLLPPLPDGDRIGGALSSGNSRSTGTRGARRAQRGLVVAQIATSFVLLIGAGLLVRTMLHLSHVDPGFDQQQVLSMDVPPNTAGRTDDQIRAQYLAVLEEVRGLPGVRDAALTSSVPLRGEEGISTRLEIDVDGHEPAPGAPTPRAEFRVVSAGYFSTMGIELLRGREFASTDLEDARGVVVINESMARTYFDDRDPIGQRIAWTDEVLKFIGLDSDWRTVVGVAADTRDDGLDADAPHTMYTPYRQVTPRFTGSLVVRVAADPAAVMPGIRETILAHDADQPITRVATIAELSDESVAPRRLNAILLGAFAGLAMVIAAVGIGGVLAFSVGSRSREFGIRGALGAAPWQVWSRVLLEGATLAGLGVALGAGLAVILTRFVSGMLVGVPALDPVTFGTVALLLTAVAVGAAWVPAWRAASVSPVEALGSD